MICSEVAKKSKQVFTATDGIFKEFVGWGRDKRQGKAKQITKKKEMQERSWRKAEMEERLGRGCT